MKILFYKDIPEDDLFENRLIRTINFEGKTVSTLLRFASEDDSKEIEHLLNKINNQGLTEFDVVKRSYVHNNTLLGLNDLSTSEKVFIVAYLADKYKFNIYLLNDITSLTETTINLFLHEFIDSDYVNIAVKSKMSLYTFNSRVDRLKV